MPGPIAFGRTDIGLLRENNEDLFVLLPEAAAFAVVDGMGGPAFGEVAAAFFADAVRGALSGGGAGSRAQAALLALEIFRNANRDIFAHANGVPGREGMGCTAELALFAGDEYVIGHVGDSRSYLFRGGTLRRITKDHSVVQDRIDRGLLSEEEARRHPMRSVILRAVGVAERVEADLHHGKLLPGDLLLLCSDGLTDMVSDDAIEAALAAPGSPAEKADRLISLAIGAGGRDNATVVLCGWSPG